MKMKEKARKKTVKPYYFLSTLLCIAILMLIVIAPANAGVRPEDGRSIGDVANGTVAIIGETNLSFVNSSGFLINSGSTVTNIKGPLEETAEAKKNSVSIYFVGTFDSTKYDEPHEIQNPLVCGEYNVSSDGRWTVIKFVYPRLIAETDTRVIKGANLTFEADTNLFHIIPTAGPNNITFSLIDPKGREKTKVGGVSLENVNVNMTGKNTRTINTEYLDTGNYTLCIKPDPDTNNGLGEDEKYWCGPPVTFEVISSVSITSDKEKAAENEMITFTVTASPNTNIILNVTSGRESKIWFIGGMEDVKESGHSCSGMTDDGGIFKAVARFAATDFYGITATELSANTTAIRSIEISEFSARVETMDIFTDVKKDTFNIGEVVKIKGRASAGDSITIKVDDEVIKTGAPVPTTTLSLLYEWKTTEDVSPGTHEIGIWVLPHSDPDKDVPDASVPILFVRGGLSAKLIYTGIEEEKEIVQEIVAQGDDFKIKGDAPGRKNVDILTIAPKGGSGNGFDPIDISTETGGALDAPGLTYSTSSVGREDGVFTVEKIDVGKDVDTGTYLVVALNPGRDEVYGSGVGDILTVITGYDFSIKTQAQILAILKEETINQAGSDDLLWVGTIEVKNPWVTLNDIGDVHLGDDIVVSGVTNRKNGFLFIITVEGPTDLIPLFAPTEVSTAGNTFTASFNTISAKVGKYTVTVNGGDGYTDTKTVNILPAITPSFNISSMPTPTPIPAPAAIMHEGEGTNESDTAAQVATPIPTWTSTSTKTGTKKKSDFVLIFIIAAAGAGLLIAVSVARLKIRKRREQGEEEEEGEKEEEKQGEDGTV
jgi:hypothetical protein